MYDPSALLGQALTATDAISRPWALAAEKAAPMRPGRFRTCMKRASDCLSPSPPSSTSSLFLRSATREPSSLMATDVV